MRSLVSCVFTLVIVGGSSVSAQTATTPRPSPPFHGFVVVNGGYQLTSNNFVDGGTRRQNAEDGRLDASYSVKAGPAFDVAGGARVWKQLAVSVGVSRYSKSTPATLNGTVPHPFFFNRLRSVGGAVSGLEREELAVHIQGRGIIDVGPRLQLMAFGGPSMFRVKQAVVTDFTISETYPYDEATLQSAVTDQPHVSKIGFNAGGDVTYFLSRRIGIGATARFAGATVDVPAAGGLKRELKVGGGTVGGGVRLRF